MWLVWLCTQVRAAELRRRAAAGIRIDNSKSLYKGFLGVSARLAGCCGGEWRGSAAWKFGTCPKAGCVLPW